MKAPSRDFDPIDADRIAQAKDRLTEAIALQEMASRCSDWNTEDFNMLKLTSCVTFRLLNEAQELMESNGDKA